MMKDRLDETSAVEIARAVEYFWETVDSFGIGRSPWDFESSATEAKGFDSGRKAEVLLTASDPDDPQNSVQFLVTVTRIQP